MSEDTAFTLTIICACSFPFIALFINHITGEDLNDKWKCSKCQVISRKGIWDLYNSNIELNDKYKCVCPVCEQIVDVVEVYEESPFAPRLNLKKCYNITKALRRNTKTAQIDKQVELYLKVQNKKLEKMNENA